MDINFHYFAVKTLAHFAGFPDQEAQRIAEYSQYIDDYNWYFYRSCSNIPDYVRNPGYDLYINSFFGNFNPAQTGFSDWFDYTILALERNQKFIVSPFHFVPRNISEAKADNRTIPGFPGDGSIIDKLLYTVIWEYVERTKQGINKQISLMRIGMLLHTFADTYAHQLFSGYNSWVNEVEVTQVINNIDNQDITEQMQEEIIELTTIVNEKNEKSIAPPIGHARAGHTPDLTNITFTMKYKSAKNSGYDMQYTRSNTETFVNTCRHIINYLGKCFNRPDVSDIEWDPLKNRLTDAFLVAMPEKKITETYKTYMKRVVEALALHWKSKFPEVLIYYYDKQIIENGFSGNVVLSDIDNATAYSEDFYRYNCMADRLLIDLYGFYPRQ